MIRAKNAYNKETKKRKTQIKSFLSFSFMSLNRPIIFEPQKFEKISQTSIGGFHSRDFVMSQACFSQ